MNSKGGATMFIVLMAICYFLFGMIIYQFLKPDISISRTNLTCTAPASAGDMITCLILDGIIPITILTIISTAGGIITEKVLK